MRQKVMGQAVAARLAPLATGKVAPLVLVLVVVAPGRLERPEMLAKAGPQKRQTGESRWSALCRTAHPKTARGSTRR